MTICNTFMNYFLIAVKTLSKLSNMLIRKASSSANNLYSSNSFYTTPEKPNNFTENLIPKRVKLDVKHSPIHEISFEDYYHFQRL
jgi:hypothetical protein